MTKNPLYNAIAAALYIVFVALIMFYGSQFAAQQEDTFFAPIALISLFTLSTAVMGYIFLYKPLELYIAGDKTSAVQLFLRTLAAFAVLTVIALILLFSGVFA